MILDSSAVVAVLLEKPDHEDLARAMTSAPSVAIGAATLAEAAVMLSARLREDAPPPLAGFLSEGSIEVVPFGEPHYAAAVDA